ncbi:MAG: Crp/Fnr family transcriptional regulator [Bacillota bacterium]
MNNLSYLKDFVLFSKMSKKQLQEIYKLLRHKSYPKGFTLFTQGEKGEKVYFLRKGRVKVIRSTPSGNEQILEIIKAGEVFGEVVLFGIDNYPATTRTMEEIETDILMRSDFKSYFHNNPQIGWGLLKVMASKLSKAQKKIEDLGLRDTKGRVANLILEMMKDSDQENKFILYLNQSEIANIVGTSRETVSRTLNEFKNENIIKFNNNHLIVKDLEKLNNYLN